MVLKLGGQMPFGLEKGEQLLLWMCIWVAEHTAYLVKGIQKHVL